MRKFFKLMVIGAMALTPLAGCGRSEGAFVGDKSMGRPTKEQIAERRALDTGTATMTDEQKKARYEESLKAKQEQAKQEQTKE